MKRLLILGAVLVAALSMSAPAHADELDPVVVVESAPAVPDVSGICVKGQDVPLPDDAPWLYGVHWDEVGNSGFVYAYLPDTHVLPNGEREWVTVGQVWEFTYPAASCAPVTAEPTVPAPVTPGGPVDPVTPGESVDSPTDPVRLAETGAESPWILTAGLALIVTGLILRRKQVA